MMRTATLARKFTLLAAASILAASASAAHARDPVGKYCGELLSSGVASEVETRFVRNVSNGTITGSYVFDDLGQPAEGMLAEAGDDGDGNDLTRLFIWRDKYGYGRLVLTFTPDFSEFQGKWGDTASASAPWNGKRCSSVSS
jgi:hypothetical protein